MNNVTVGKIITDHAERDAIHIAVYPAVAAVKLEPGCHVGPYSDGHWSNKVKDLCGIVDPFLNRTVQKDERFWVFLYPNTITNMRHHWSHPAFDNANLPTFDDILRSERGEPGTDKAASEAWLRLYAAKLNCYDEPEQAYKRMMEGLKTGYLVAHGTDMYSLGDLRNHEELRQHAELILGKRVNFNTFTFSCSC